MLSRLKHAFQHKIFGETQVDYKKNLPPTDDELREIVQTKRLNHLAIVPFGNTKWALERGLDRFEGRSRVGTLLPQLLIEAWRLGIHTVTVAAVSQDGFKRDAVDLNNVFEVLQAVLKNVYPMLLHMKVRLVHKGNKNRLPKSFVQILQLVEEKTALNARHFFNLCIDYSAHEEMERSFQRLLARGITTPEQVTEIAVYRSSDTGNQLYPNPDFIIRTGKVCRLPDFALWQTASSELYFPPKHFPDFTKEDLRAAIVEFGGRVRSYGGD